MLIKLYTMLDLNTYFSSQGISYEENCNFDVYCFQQSSFTFLIVIKYIILRNVCLRLVSASCIRNTMKTSLCIHTNINFST